MLKINHVLFLMNEWMLKNHEYVNNKTLTTFFLHIIIILSTTISVEKTNYTSYLCSLWCWHVLNTLIIQCLATTFFSPFASLLGMTWCPPWPPIDGDLFAPCHNTLGFVPGAGCPAFAFTPNLARSFLRTASLSAP